MPVAILGMHRSGTSMVAQMLGLAGLELGPDEALLPASPDNPDGYFEHAGFHGVNEAILGELGGGWDRPPAVPQQWDESDELASFRADAARLVGSFEGTELWGWKDPRTCLTFGLWQQLIPDLRAVVCVRHPLEVALSLNRRGMFSFTTGLELWRAYNERILDATTPEQRLVTHYDAFFDRPRAELRRVASFLGLEPSASALAAAAAVPQDALRHTRFGPEHLRDLDVADDIVDLYEWLSAQARSRRRHTRPQERPSRARTGVRVVDERAVGAEMTRRTIDAHLARIESLERLVQEQEGALAWFHDREAELRAEVEALRTRVAPDADIVRQLDDIQASFYTLEVAVRKEPTTDDAAAAYTKQIRRIKEIVQRETPIGAAVAVVSKGDERQLGFYGRRGLHFPQSDDGTFAGGGWASGLSAVAHLEVLRARGATHFLVPAMELWWLEHYDELRRHVANRYRPLVWDGTACALFDLHGPPDPRTRWRREAVELVAALRSELGRTPRVLDLNSGLELAEAVPATEIVARPFDGVPLPFPDASIEIVALKEGDPALLEDARRVARAAVLGLPRAGSPNGTPSLLLAADAAPQDLGHVSLVCGLAAGTPPEPFLRSLEETLPTGFAGELVLVDASANEDAATLDTFAAPPGARTTVIRAAGADPIGAAAQGAAAAQGDTLVFLGSELLLLPGWLRPLLDLLRERPGAGAVGGRLLSANGSLAAAGGVVLKDGSTLAFGLGEPDPGAALYEHVRRADYCPALFFATPRGLFEDAGGLDARSSSLLQAAADYSFTLRREGHDTYYQPASTAVLQANTADDLHGAADPRFVRKWRSVLRHRPPRPQVLDSGALHALAAASAEG